MKTRNGFVSNSSSSSFVIALKNDPKTAKELEEVLFSNGFNPTDYDGEELCKSCVAKRVFADINYFKYGDKKIEDILEWADEAENIKKFLSEHKGEFVYELSYSDNDGDVLSAEIESGVIFDNIPYIRISSH